MGTDGRRQWREACAAGEAPPLLPAGTGRRRRLAGPGVSAGLGAASSERPEGFAGRARGSRMFWQSQAAAP